MHVCHDQAVGGQQVFEHAATQLRWIHGGRSAVVALAAVRGGGFAVLLPGGFQGIEELGAAVVTGCGGALGPPAEVEVPC